MRNTRKSGQILWSKKRSRPTLRSGRGSRTNSNTSHQIPAQVIEVDKVILDIEMNLHLKLCAGWGLSPSDLEQTPPAVEMLAYTRYVLDAGMRGDLLALKVALAPCVIGYAEIATRLFVYKNDASMRCRVPKIARHAALGHMNDYDLENQTCGPD